MCPCTAKTHHGLTVRCSPCQTCRTRKKKCYHYEELPSDIPRPDGQTRESTVSPEGEGPYHPESVLVALSQSHPESERIVEHQQELSINGEPHQPDLESAEQSPSTIQRQRRQLTWYKKQTHGATPPKLTDAHRRYLEEVDALIELPQTTTDALIPIYISFLDDLLPVLDGAKVFRDYSNKQCSKYLVRAICLVVAKYQQAAPFLRLSDDSPLLSCLDFTDKLLTGLEAALKAELEPNRVTKIQILTLMHLHNDGVSGLDRSSSYLSQAISEAWALSLHQPFPRQGDQEQSDMLWWSLRNLDRLNKVVMGAAPFMIDDTDIGIWRTTPRNDSYRTQVMGLSLILGDLMATATKVYKASSKATIDTCQSFPSFLELVSGADLECLHQSHRSK